MRIDETELTRNEAAGAAEGTADDASGSRDLVPILLAAAAVCLVFVTRQLETLGGRLGFPLDDAWIHLAFGRSMAAGEGLAIAGERVTGSTAPLWTTLAAVAELLPGSPLAWLQAFGILCHLGTIAAVWRLAGLLGLGRVLAGFAAVLAAATGWLAWSAVSGLEIPLFTLLSTWGLVLHVGERRRPERLPLSFALFGLGVLARPEGALLVALAAADRLLVARREPAARSDRRFGALRFDLPGRQRLAALAAGLGLVALAAGPSIAAYQAIGGSPLPTTYAVKAGSGGLSVPELGYLWSVLGILFRAQPWSCLLAGAGAAVLARRLGTPRDAGLLPVLWLFGLPFAYGLIAHPGAALAGNFGRYYFPLFPVLAVVGVLGLSAIARSLGPWRSGPRRALAAAALALFLWPTAGFLGRSLELYAQSLRDVDGSDVAVARELAAVLPADAVVAVVDLGAAAYFLPNRLIDLAGIATPEARRAAARSAAATGDHRPGLAAFLERERPDFLLTYPAWFAPPEGAGYRRLTSVPIPGNVTMAGDELVLYATPWARRPATAPRP